MTYQVLFLLSAYIVYGIAWPARQPAGGEGATVWHSRTWNIDELKRTMYGVTEWGVGMNA